MEGTNPVMKWLYLIVGVVIIALFMFIIAPAVERSSNTFGELSAFIDRHDLETGAYVYTDSELAAKAAIGARSTMEYTPVGPKQP